MRLAGLLVAAALVASACAGPGALSPAAARDLQAHVAAVRESAEARDAGAAAAELDELRGAVTHWVETGDLSRSRADEILATAEDVEAALALLSEPAEDPPPTDEPEPQEPAVEDPEPEATQPEEEPQEDQGDDGDDDEESPTPGSEGPGSGGSSGPG